MKRVNELTRVFLKEFYQKFVLNKCKVSGKNRKLSFGMLMIIIITIAYLSNKGISIFIRIGEPTLFLSIYLLVLAIVLIFQTILISGNIYFLSKDTEYVIPLPIKDYEILISKYNVVLFFVYLTELIIGGVPLIIYGLKFFISIKYFIFMIVVLLLFPILFVTIISIITIFLMYFSKFLKNKKMYQTIITIVMLISMFLFENNILNGLVTNNESLEHNNDVKEQIVIIDNNLKRVNEKFLIINPAIKLLDINTNFIIDIKSMLQIVGYNIFFGLILLLISKKVYIKTILNFFENKQKVNKKKEVKIKKVNKIGIAYLKKEYKVLFRRPSFLMQTIMPLFIILITVIIIVVAIIPSIDKAIRNEDTIVEAFSEIPFNIETYCIILIIVQILYSLSNLSLTAISREGKDALFMKYIPISYYNQFKYKSMLQIIVNLIVSLIILSIVYYLMPEIGIINIFIVFIISVIINYINSYLMLLVDLRRPNLYWNTEIAVIKNSGNKGFQYGFMIVNVLILMYLGKILKDINITVAIIIEAFVFAVVLIILNIIIKKYCNKIFDNIN